MVQARGTLLPRARLYLAAAACFLILGLATKFVLRDGLSPSAQPKTLDLSSYRLSFSEEFDELSVSAWGPGTRWIAHTPWKGDFGDARFSDPSPEFPFTTENGVLRIEARKMEDGTWNSGLLASADTEGNGFSQQYGYFEIRAKLPAGQGIWAAFWLAGISRAEATPEIDVFEFYGSLPTMFESTVHTWFHGPTPRHSIASNRTSVKSGSLSEDFHVYGVEVDQDTTVFYFDGQETWRTPTLGQHHQPMLILLNLALGSGWPIDRTPSPSFMYVDYVRAYVKI